MKNIGTVEISTSSVFNEGRRTRVKEQIGLFDNLLGTESRSKMKCLRVQNFVLVEQEKNEKFQNVSRINRERVDRLNFFQVKTKDESMSLVLTSIAIIKQRAEANDGVIRGEKSKATIAPIRRQQGEIREIQRRVVQEHRGSRMRLFQSCAV